MWLVVIFKESNTVAAVPNHWFSDGQCAWPKLHIKNRSKMIEMRKRTNAFDFDFFEARKLATDKPIESLVEAKNKAKIAQITSDLSSTESYIEKKKKNYNATQKRVINDAEQRPKKLRRLKPPMYIPPPMDNTSDIDDGRDDSDADKSYTPYRNDNNPSSDESTGHISSNFNEKNTEQQLSITNKVTSFKNPTEFSYKTDRPNENYIEYGTDPSTYKSSIVFETPKHSNSSVPAITISSNNDFESFVKTTLTNLKYEIKSISYSIETLKNMMAQVLDSSTSKQIPENNILDGIEIMWPIENAENMDKIENLLSDSKIKNNQAIILSRLVGSKINDTVRRIMQRMFVDIFIKDYSYVGFKGKNKFSGLNCCQLLFDAVRKNKKFDMTPDEEISTAVSKWMAQASNRINQKNKTKTLAGNGEHRVDS